MRPRHLVLFSVSLLVLGTLLQPAWATATVVRTTLTQRPAVPAGSRVRVENLAGHMTVIPGSQFQVTATVVAGGKDQAAAEALAKRVKLSVSGEEGQVSVRVDYPVDRYDAYSYVPHNAENQEHSGDNRCILFFCFSGGETGLRYQGERVRVYGGNRGVPLHVNVAVTLPAGTAGEFTNYVGRVSAEGLHSDVKLAGASSDLYAGHIQGAVSAKTGSGDVRISSLTGSLSASTGSGDVRIGKSSGDLKVSTGSGDVILNQAQHGRARIGTGSGDVNAADVALALEASTGSGDVVVSNLTGSGDFSTGSGDISIKKAATSQLKAGTGSGDITIHALTAIGTVNLGTGSGEISVRGDLGGVTRLVAKTGSGDIVIHTTAVPSLHIVADSDSGEVHVNLPDMRNISVKRGYLRADVNGAKGSANLETGSGDISVSQK